MNRTSMAAVNRRSVLAGLAGLLLASTTNSADAAVRVRLITRNSGNKVRVRVRLSGSAAGINFGSRTLGPIYVPRNGSPVTVTYNVLGVVVTVILVIIAIVLTVVTFGSLAGPGEIFRQTVKKSVPA